MKPLLALLVLVVGCQSGQSNEKSDGKRVETAPAASSYAADIAALCDAMSRSGADKEPAAAQLTVANWLGANLKTDDSRKFLVKISPLTGTDKAAALEGEAKRVGLDGCALAELWRKPAAK